MTKRVIIADDHQSWREMYVHAIRFAFPDVNIDEVESGADLVKRVLQGDYSAVVSDNDMEDKGAGLTALRTIRESGNNVPFYLISAGTNKDTALNSGANGFYKKAESDSDQLIADITQYLK